MSPPQDHHLTQILHLSAGMWVRQTGISNIVCAFLNLPVPCVSFRSKKTTLMVSVSPPLDLTPPIILPFARQPLTTPAGGSIDFIFCHRTGASTQIPRLPSSQAARPGSLLEHKGLPPWLTRDLLEEGSLQVTWQQVPSAMWEDADKDGRQLLAGCKLALDALVPEQLLLTD